MKKNSTTILCAFLFGTAALVMTGCSKSGVKKNSKIDAEQTSAYADQADTDFTVVSFTPEGELSSSIKFPSIQVQFSQPVIAVEKLGSGSDTSDVMTITPPLKGTYRWYGTSLLSFDSSEEVIPQKDYKIVINKKLSSILGKTLSGNTSYSFHTEELHLTSILAGYEEVKKGNEVQQDDVPVEMAKDIAVFFNTKVNVKTIQKELRVATEDNTTYEFTATQGSDVMVRLSLKKAPPADVDVAVSLPMGSMADEDCYPTSQDQSIGFHTLKPFIITDFIENAEYLNSAFANPVEFIMSHPLKQGAEAEIAKHITTTPAMKIEAKNISLGGRTLVVHSLPVTYNSMYKIHLDESLADVYGLKLGTTATYEVKVPKALSYIHYKDAGSKMLESQFPPKIVFQYQNMVQENSTYSLSALSKANGEKISDQNSKFDYADKELLRDTKVTEVVDLSPVLEQVGNERRGEAAFISHLYYMGKKYNYEKEEYEDEPELETNYLQVQVTDLGVTVRWGYNRALVLVTSLKTGKPVANATVNLISYRESSSIGTAMTDTQGLAVINIENDVIAKMHRNRRYDDYSTTIVEVTTKDDHVIFNPDINNMWQTAVVNTDSPYDAENMKLVSFMFTDRGLYKPGETVTFRGIDRRLKTGVYTTNTGDYTLRITDGSWDPTVYETRNGELSQNGTFWGQWKIPEDFEPGTYSISFERNNPQTGRLVKSSVSFQVQFFERLRFEAKSEIPSVTYYIGDKLNANVSAQYLGGGSLGGCAYTSYWSREPVGFAPENERFADMRFGPLLGYDGRTSLDQKQGALSGDGKATISQQTGGEKIKGMTYSYRVETQVTDSGNQMISTTSNVLVHPARFYLGVSSMKGVNGYPKKGDTLKFNYQCITPEGGIPSVTDLPKGNKKKITVELLREDWKQVQQIGWDGQINSRYVRDMVNEETKTVELKAESFPSEVSVVPPKGGLYLLRLSSVDGKGNDVVTETRFYVTSSDWMWYDRDNAQEITMTCDKDRYSIGDTAHILVQSALPKGTYLMTIEREGILSQKIINLDVPTSVIDVKVEGSFLPIMYVTLSSYSVRTGKPQNTYDTPDLDKPKGYFGLAAIHVNPEPMAFDVEIKTDKPSYRPGEEAKITLHASKNKQALANAEITLMAVDRGVIDLINYHVADPINNFYDEHLFPDCIEGGDSRSLLLDPVTYEIRNLVGGDSADDSSKSQERKNFEPTALFVPDLVTDSNGNVSYTFKLPDSLTAYRITAVGVKDNYFSLDESEMPVANPVSVRDVLPRKLRLSDEGEAGVTISNLDAVDHSVTVKLALYDGVEKAGVVQTDEEVQKLPGKAEVKDKDEQTIVVKANTTVPLMFTIHAKSQGWITVEYTVKSDVVNERILKTLEIEKPYVYETVTTVGEVRGENTSDNAQAEERIVIPGNVEDDMGNIYIQLDPTHLGVLSEAVNYVFRYPYGCMEQRSSCVLPLVAFGKYMKVFGLDGEVTNAESVAKEEIRSWKKIQLADGGFPYWPDQMNSNMFVSLRIGEIIALAEEKNIHVKRYIDFEKLAGYIRNQINSYKEKYKNNAYESYYMNAYAYYVLARLGENVPDDELKSIIELNKSNVDQLAFCGLAYYAMGNKEKALDVANRIKKLTKLSTRGINVVGDDNYYWSYFTDKAETYSLMLDLFSRLAPEDEINMHLVYELLELEKAGKGYWCSTVVTSRVLCGLDVYIRTNNLEKTNFTAEALLDGKEFVQGSFKGLAAQPVEERVLLSDESVKSIKRDAEIPVVLSKKGTGILYYTISLKHAIPANEQYAKDNGICMFNIITDVETNQIVEGNKLVAGKVYREQLFISTTFDRQYVAVRAPIPAGCEIMNAAFVTTGTFKHNEQTEKTYSNDDYYDDDCYDDDYYDGNYNYGLSHQAIFDSEVQYFWDYFPQGNQQVEFLFRASRKGLYNTPPATAECMYEPEVYGRNSGKIWTIE